MRVLNLSFGNKILFIVGPDKSLAPPGPDGAHLGMEINRYKFDGGVCNEGAATASPDG